MVAHSYGGVVVTNGVEGFSLAHRQASGKKGGVILLIYMSAFVVPKGMCLMDMFGGNIPPWIKVEVRDRHSHEIEVFFAMTFDGIWLIHMCSGRNRHSRARPSVSHRIQRLLGRRYSEVWIRDNTHKRILLRFSYDKCALDGDALYVHILQS